MKISECFLSLQGEGIYIGVRSFFVRTFGCNLSCIWCDTTYARANANEPYFSYTPREICDQFLESGAEHLVITGGEPTIQNIELDKLLRLVKQEKPQTKITLETNGTKPQPYEKGYDCIDLLSVSPKLSNAKTKQTSIQDVISWLLHVSNYQLKFVIETENDVVEMMNFVSSVESYIKGTIPRDYLFLMPQTHKPKATNICINACETFGFRFCTRLHITLWQGKRGV